MGKELLELRYCVRWSELGSWVVEASGHGGVPARE